MDEQVTNSKADMLNRLRRIEGQVKGIQRMVEEDKGCSEILTQIAAVRSAINRVGGLILERYSMTCIGELVSAEDREKALDDLSRTMHTFMKFTE